MRGALSGVLRKANGGEPPVWRTIWGTCQRFVTKVCIRKKPHQLRLEETLPLGDRRFLAVVHWERERLLVGVTPQNITLIAPQRRDAAKREEFVRELEGGCRE